MGRYLMGVLAATLAFVGLVTSAPAEASPIRVTVTAPRLLVAPAPVVAVHTARPGPAFVWVTGTWRRDALGRSIWVPGHWRHPVSGMVVRSPGPVPVPTRTVTVVRR